MALQPASLDGVVELDKKKTEKKRSRARPLGIKAEHVFEAMLNALCAADAMEGHSGHHAPALPLESIRGIMDGWKGFAGDKTQGSP